MIVLLQNTFKLLDFQYFCQMTPLPLRLHVKKTFNILLTLVSNTYFGYPIYAFVPSFMSQKLLKFLLTLASNTYYGYPIYTFWPSFMSQRLLNCV